MPGIRTDLYSLLNDPRLLTTKAFLVGKWADADDGATFTASNPARSDVIAEVADVIRTLHMESAFAKLGYLDRKASGSGEDREIERKLRDTRDPSGYV